MKEKTLEKKVKEKTHIENKPKNWWSKWLNRKKFKRPNSVAVIYLRNNGSAEMMRVETKNDFFSIKGSKKSYHERRDCTFTVGKDRIPLAIIPEWGLTPQGTKKWDDKPMQEKFAALQDHVLNGIRHAELIKSGGGMGGIDTKKAVGLGIMAIVFLAILFNYI